MTEINNDEDDDDDDDNNYHDNNINIKVYVRVPYVRRRE